MNVSTEVMWILSGLFSVIGTLIFFIGAFHLNSQKESNRQFKDGMTSLLIRIEKEEVRNTSQDMDLLRHGIELKAMSRTASFDYEKFADTVVSRIKSDPPE
jgi:hypothetical protein